MYTSAAVVRLHMQCYFYAKNLKSYTSTCLCICVYMQRALKEYVCKSIHIQRICADVYENKYEGSAQLCTCIDAHGPCFLWLCKLNLDLKLKSHISHLNGLLCRIKCFWNSDCVFTSLWHVGLKMGSLGSSVNG